MAVPCSEVKWREIATVHSVWVGFSGEENLGQWRVAFFGSVVKRRAFIPVLGVWVGLSGEKHLGHAHVAVPCSEVKWRAILTVHGMWVGSRGEEDLGNWRVKRVRLSLSSAFGLTPAARRFVTVDT